MPIAIATGTNVATVTESASLFGRAYDGITAAFKAEAVTGREHQASMIVSNLASVAVGSFWARSNVKKGQAPMLKFWG